MAVAPLKRNDQTLNPQGPSGPLWERIQALSDEMIETAKAGDWSHLLVLENEWLDSIKKFIVDYQSQKAEEASVDYLEDLLDINNELYQQCKQSRQSIESKIVNIRNAKQGMSKVKSTYGTIE